MARQRRTLREATRLRRLADQVLGRRHTVNARASVERVWPRHQGPI
jgi:hypothetical protein